MLHPYPVSTQVSRNAMCDRVSAVRVCTWALKRCGRAVDRRPSARSAGEGGLVTAAEPAGAGGDRRARDGSGQVS
jgi:hypothetical protein